MSSKRIKPKPLLPSLQTQNNYNFSNNQRTPSTHSTYTSINTSLSNMKLKIKLKEKIESHASNSKLTPTNVNQAGSIACEQGVELCKLAQNRSKTENYDKLQQNCQNYFLRQIVFILYKYFEKNEVSWNLQKLNYKQLLIILKEMRYIKQSSQQNYQQGLKSSGLTQLKQCYWLWNNIRVDKHFNLVNLVIMLLCVQSLQFDVELIKEVVYQLIKGISKFTLADPSGEPKYIFLVKKEGFIFCKDGFLKLGKAEKDRIQHELKNFKYNKLMFNTPLVELYEIEQVQKVSLSKKSLILAINKRQKILQQIRENEPEIKNIQLYHLLSYKETTCKSKTQKTELCELYVSNKNTEPSLIIKPFAEISNNNYQKQQPSMKKMKNKNKKMLKQNLYIPKNSVKGKLKGKQAADVGSKRKFSLNVIQEKHQKQNEQVASIIKCNPFQDYLEDQDKQFLDFNQPVKSSLLQNILNDEQQIPLKESSILFEEQIHEGETTVQPLPSFTKNFNNKPLRNKQPKKRQYFQIPILYVDVNIEQGKKQRIVIYDGDTASDLAVQFGKKFGLNQQMIMRLQLMLEQQIKSVLCKIEQALEEDCSYLY